jgi:hypothetical protein
MSGVLGNLKNLGSKLVSGVGSVAVGAKDLAVKGATGTASAVGSLVSKKPSNDVAAASTVGGRRRKSRKSKKSKKKTHRRR